MAKYITLKQLTRELGLDKSNLRRYILKHGFSFIKIRTPESRSQLTLALSLEDAEAVRMLRESNGFGPKQQPVQNDVGYFYIIQLIPELNPLRVKLGLASDVESRLRAHRTSAPTAQLVKAWPCRKAWESTAIASITRVGCNLIANEVYECDDLRRLISYTDDFFRIMPKVINGIGGASQYKANKARR